jgi:hypothetical protein
MLQSLRLAMTATMRAHRVSGRVRPKADRARMIVIGGKIGATLVRFVPRIH